MEKQNTYTLTELADYYNVNKRTLYTWLKPIRKELLDMHPGNTKRMGVLIPRQVKFIKEFLG